MIKLIKEKRPPKIQFHEGISTKIGMRLSWKENYPNSIPEELTNKKEHTR